MTSAFFHSIPPQGMFSLAPTARRALLCCRSVPKAVFGNSPWTRIGHEVVPHVPADLEGSLWQKHHSTGHCSTTLGIEANLTKGAAQRMKHQNGKPEIPKATIPKAHLGPLQLPAALDCFLKTAFQEL